MLGALSRNPAATAEPSLRRLLGLTAEDFTQRSGLDVRTFVLAVTGHIDPKPLRLPDAVNIYRP